MPYAVPSMDYQASVRKVPSSSNIIQSAECQEKHKEFVFLAVFGDYVAQNCKEVQNLGNAFTINHFDSWIEADLAAERDERSLEEWTTDAAPPTPTLDGIIEAAAALRTRAAEKGFRNVQHYDRYLIRFWIKMYARCNTTFHNGIGEYIELAAWGCLATEILRSYATIMDLCPESMGNDRQYVKQTIRAVEVEYFESLRRVGLDKAPAFGLTDRAQRIAKRANGAEEKRMRTWSEARGSEDAWVLEDGTGLP
ncbi:MAG: hypothetical protein M1833_006868 [Piccolia ochrophora]|nr:MAG: hypothetical protein M1833_006868 [Piccolia ochrophora]